MVVGHYHVATFAAYVFLDGVEVDEVRVVDAEEVVLRQHVFVFFERSAHHVLLTVECEDKGIVAGRFAVEDVVYFHEHQSIGRGERKLVVFGRRRF